MKTNNILGEHFGALFSNTSSALFKAFDSLAGAVSDTNIHDEANEIPLKAFRKYINASLAKQLTFKTPRQLLMYFVDYFIGFGGFHVRNFN